MARVPPGHPPQAGRGDPEGSLVRPLQNLTCRPVANPVTPVIKGISDE